jgi:hypothetical protein
MKCKNCNINEAVKYSKYSSGEFCSKSCSASFSTSVNRKLINEKISFKLKGTGNENVKLNCPYCKSEFIVNWKYRHQISCSRSCNKREFMTNSNIASEMGKKSVSIQSKNRRSKNEIYFAELCKKRFNEVKFNEPMFNGWDADIVIEDLKLAVLWNGKWHYEKITEKHSVEQVQNRDKIKQQEIIKSGYEFYVIKDMGKYKKEFVENKFKEMLAFLKL